MDTGSAARARGGSRAWRFWGLLPIVVLAGVVSLFAATGGSLLDLVGRAPPPLDQFEIRRIEFKPGEIRARVTNPQRAKLTVAAVTVDDAIVPFRVEGSSALSRLRSSTVVIPFDWVEGDPYSVGITSSHGVETRSEAAAVESRGASTRGFLGYAVIGLLVGVVPVALGLAWLPSLRRADARWLAAFMALTAGLLTFLALDAFAEALELQSSLPSGFQGPGLILVGVAVSYLGLTLLAQRLSTRGRRGRDAPLEGLALAGLIAAGIGLHNLGEGLAIGSSVALGEVALGTFLIVGFMVHNLTEGLGIASPIAAGERTGSGAWRRSRRSPARLRSPAPGSAGS